jgi:fermentation-respiration switch protein FrsA (DUF1100 family)
MTFIRRLAVAIVVFVVGNAAIMIGAGVYITAPDNHPMNIPDKLDVTAVAIPSASGSTLAGWYMPGAVHGGAVVLLPGWLSTRHRMVSRMQFLHDAGYSVLAVDLQAHGESPGKRITFGRLESLDAEAAVAWVRTHALGERVGVIGVSMGGAAALLAPHGLGADALVLESVFPDFRRAVANRVADYVGAAASAPLAAAFLALSEPTLGVGDERPVDRIGDIGVPVFVISGERDTNTPPAEARELFARASDPKWLWLVPGARHVDFDRTLGTPYRRQILEFFTTYVRRGTAVGRNSAYSEGERDSGVEDATRTQYQQGMDASPHHDGGRRGSYGPTERAGVRGSQNGDGAGDHQAGG